MYDYEGLAYGLRRKYKHMTVAESMDMAKKWPSFVTRIVGNYNRVLAAAKAGKTGNIDKKKSVVDGYGYIDIKDRGFASTSSLTSAIKRGKSIPIGEVKKLFKNHKMLGKMNFKSNYKKVVVLDMNGVSLFCKWWLGNRKSNSSDECRKVAHERFGLTSVGTIIDRSCNQEKYKKKFPNGRVSTYNVILCTYGGKLYLACFDPMNGRPLKVRPSNHYLKGERGTVKF